VLSASVRWLIVRAPQALNGQRKAPLSFGGDERGELLALSGGWKEASRENGNKRHHRAKDCDPAHLGANSRLLRFTRCACHERAQCPPDRRNANLIFLGELLGGVALGVTAYPAKCEIRHSGRFKLCDKMPACRRSGPPHCEMEISMSTKDNSKIREVKTDELDAVSGGFVLVPRPPVGPAYPAPSPTTPPDGMGGGGCFNPDGTHCP
jgi:hypothetical protein